MTATVVRAVCAQTYIQTSNSRRTTFRILAARCARGLHRFHPLSKKRAQGKPGADGTRGRAHNERTSRPQVNRSSGFPCTMGYGLLRALPGEPSTLATVALRIDDAFEPGWTGCISARLDASMGRQDHTTSPSAPASPKLPPDLVRIRASFIEPVSSAVRPRAGKSLTESNPPCDSLRARRCRVHRIPPRVRASAKRPSFG